MLHFSLNNIHYHVPLLHYVAIMKIHIYFVLFQLFLERQQYTDHIKTLKHQLNETESKLLRYCQRFNQIQVNFVCVTLSCIHLFIPSILLSRLLSSFHPFNHSFVHSSVYPFIHPFTHPHIHTFIHPPTHSHIHPPTHSSTYLFILYLCTDYRYYYIIKGWLSQIDWHCSWVSRLSWRHYTRKNSKLPKSLKL